MELKEMIKRYGLRLGVNAQGQEGIIVDFTAKMKRDNALEMLKANKPALISYFKAEKAENERKAQERRERIASIEGLAEIKAALRDLESWHEEWEDSFRDVGGMGVREKPQYDIPAMKAKYPHAAAYLRAEEYSHKSNVELFSIGQKALEEVIFGDWKAAMEYMDRELSEFSNRHAWD